MLANDQPSLTEIYTRAADFVPACGSAYLFMRSPEERSEHFDSWRANAEGISFVELSESTSSALQALIGSRTEQVFLRSEKNLRGLWNSIEREVVYIDMTGLAHHVWAPLLRSALHHCSDVRVIYVEPGDYQHSGAPIEGQIFDLSERIAGVGPLPGFAFLGRIREADSIFVPLLGFEGTRFSHLLEQVQPSNDRIIPIIGVPGFRLEYPFHTFLGNKRPLEETAAWQRARYATANCPFSVYYILERIASDHPRSVLQIAPIGTKPHALGAILFKIVSKRSVEIVYDYPIRKSGRTRGTDHLLVYYVSAIGA